MTFKLIFSHLSLMRYLLFILSTFLFGCSSSNNTLHNNDLLDSFNKYKSLYGPPREQTLLKKELWEALVEARSITDKTAFVDPLAKFPTEITKIIDTKESIDDKDGCLLVSGTNTSGVPLDYYISFNREDNRWIINEVTAKYFLDGSERYLEKAVCDEQERMNLWLESMESRDNS